MHLHSSFLQVKHLFILLFFTLSLLGAGSISAHEIRPSIVDINFDSSGQYQMAIKLNLEAMIANVGI